MMKTGTKEKINYTLSSFAVEGLKPSKDAIRLYEQMDAGRITLRETIAAIERKHSVGHGNK